MSYRHPQLMRQESTFRSSVAIAAVVTLPIVIGRLLAGGVSSEKALLIRGVSSCIVSKSEYRRSDAISLSAFGRQPIYVPAASRQNDGHDRDHYRQLSHQTSYCAHPNTSARHWPTLTMAVPQLPRRVA
jgi:hypothetical protein